MSNNGENFTISQSAIMDYFFTKLTAAGYAVGEGEVQSISEVVFDYLIDLGIIEEVIYLDPEDEE